MRSLLPRSVCAAGVLVFVLAVSAFATETPVTPPPQTPAKRVLILYEGGPDRFSNGLGDARQLEQLLGHFNTTVALAPVSDYRAGEIARSDFAFYIGYSLPYSPPADFLKDVYGARESVIWLNTGIERLAQKYDLAAKYGFTPVAFDATSGFDRVDGEGHTFTKTEPRLTIVKVTDPSRCTVVATATSSRTKVQVPYIVHSGGFWYVADSPFAYATETDRYLLFADLLHDILGEDHPASHSAAIRIEDTNPFSDPESLREVADILSQRGIPFLVGVIPFYVNPATSTRVAMSDKPDYVDALRYMVAHGGTVVMHGVTHQYKGETATDYEFWDESRDKPLPNDSQELVERKLREGILECTKNGIFPLLWETPHYGASDLDYSVIAKHFSSAIEQRLVLDRLDFSQYFPYIIRRDIYRQRVYPENLGYVPLGSDQEEQDAVDHLISYARANLAVRDGFVTAFFHPFVNLSLLPRLVDGIRDLGYTFVDVRDDPQTVTLNDHAIVCGKGDVTLTLHDQYLREETIDANGEVVRRDVSPKRIAGSVTRAVSLPRRWVYFAEPVEYRERQLTMLDRTKMRAAALWRAVVPHATRHTPADALLLTDGQASGGALNDQTSLGAALEAVNIPVETVTVSPDRPIVTAGHNLVLVPYNVAELLSEEQIDALVAWVKEGGHVITDFRNPVAQALGVKFLDSTILIEHARDTLFPDEVLRWKSGEVMSKFDGEDNDDILVRDDVTEIPVAFSRQIGRGGFIFFGTRFDPLSTGGFSRFPYLVAEVHRAFALAPALRREQLEVYFDPGYRHSVSIEQLVTRWADLGIRKVYVGGWHEYAKYTYDYRHLIDLAHANGILVVAWLEPPQVSEKFWNEHPQWREKNYKGQDVRASWRYPVALTDPDCLAAALSTYRRLLERFDWDGVNIGELYFEGDLGAQDPASLTPMHPSARAEFKKLAGFDPAKLFEPSSPLYFKHNPQALAAFLRYRVAKVTSLHEAMLAMASSVRQSKPGFEVMVTLLDQLSAPDLRERIGVDARAIAALREKVPFTIQVEDPASMWSTDPRRYETIGQRWSFVDPSALALDLNILVIRTDKEITPFPTRIQTGSEATWLVHAAAEGARRVAIYSESSVNQQDLALFPYAYAAGVKVQRVGDEWTITTPSTLVVELGENAGEVILDGQHLHAAGDGRYIVPVGTHTVRVLPETLQVLTPDLLETRLVSITGELRSIEPSERSVRFSYASDQRCFATFNREPFALFVDRQEMPFEALRGSGRFALKLPPGEHSVLVVTQSSMSYGVDITSFWSALLIAGFGAVASGLLIALWVAVRTTRKAA